MLKPPLHPYAFSTTLAASYDQAMARTKAALSQEGFGVLTEIDMKKTMKDKLNADFRSYCILGACNPVLAYHALQADLEVGLLLPCNVIVYDSGNSTSTVEVLDPEAGLGIIGQNPAIATVAREAKDRLRRVVHSLGT